MSSTKVLMFGWESNLCEMFDRKHSGGVSTAFQPRDIPLAHGVNP